MATILVPDVSAQAVAVSETKVISSQLDTSQKSLYAPIYKWRRLLQIAGGSGLTLTTGTSNSIFNIPGGGVYNLNRSYLMFDLNLTTGGGALLNTVWCDQVPINDITLQTQTGQIIANLINVPAYTKTARLVCMGMKDYLSREAVRANTTVAASFATQNCFCQPARIAETALAAAGVLGQVAGAGGAAAAATCVIPTSFLTSAALSANRVTSQYIPSGAGVSVIPMAAASGIDCDYLSPQRLASGGAPAAVIMRCRVDLSAFVGTVLAMDKNLYFGGQNLQLVINWSPLNKWGFVSNVDGAGGLAAITAASTFTNYYLFLAQEMCAENIMAAQANVNKPGGQVMYVPYTICPKLNVGAGGLTTMNTPLVAGFGILKRVLSVVVDATDVNNLSSNNDNVAQAKYTTVQSFLNNSPLQDWALSCANGDDYNVLTNLLENTPAGISGRNFRINSFWLDNFSDACSGEDFNANDLMDSGHEIVNSENYSIQYNLAAAANIYQYATFLRRLVVTGMNLQWA